MQCSVKKHPSCQQRHPSKRVAAPCVVRHQGLKIPYKVCRQQLPIWSRGAGPPTLWETTNEPREPTYATTLEQCGTGTGHFLFGTSAQARVDRNRRLQRAPARLVATSMFLTTTEHYSKGRERGGYSLVFATSKSVWAGYFIGFLFVGLFWSNCFIYLGRSI